MTLRVTLLHNQEAGFEQCSPEQLLTALRSKGYESTYQAMKEDFTQALRHPGDIVAIAGGDGTVGKIARQMVGRNIPIGILPLGTANNIATTLGIRGEPADIIARWDLSRRRSFDAAG